MIRQTRQLNGGDDAILHVYPPRPPRSTSGDPDQTPEELEAVVRRYTYLGVLAAVGGVLELAAETEE